MNYDIKNYKIVLDDSSDEFHLPESLLEIMLRHPIYLNHKFSHLKNDSTSSFQRLICEKMCENFWNDLLETKKLLEKENTSDNQDSHKV